MFSPSDRSVAHILIGEGDDPAIGELLSARAGRVTRLRLSGAPGDGLRLLRAIASSDQVVCSPWPSLGGAGQAAHPEHRA